jgi:hypothetical protein
MIKKILFLFFCVPLMLYGTVIDTKVSFTGNPIVTLRSISQVFNTIGYKFDVDSLSYQDNSGEFRGKAIGNKQLNAVVLAENIKEQGTQIEQAHLNSEGLTLVLNTQKATWNVPLIGMDDGVELKKVNTAQWFRVEEGQHIKIQPPYAGKWYPDIAVLDSNMSVLSSFRSTKSEDEFQFELPSGAYYLKVSNIQGMKVLKEGMWIESMSPGR